MHSPSCAALELLLEKYANEPFYMPLHNRLRKSLSMGSLHDALDQIIALYKESIPLFEHAFWKSDRDELEVSRLHELYRELESLIALKDSDDRHMFVIVIPVADRPRHLKNCLDSLYNLCKYYNYGGKANGKYRKLAVIIADDSKIKKNVAQNIEIARRTRCRGIETFYFGLIEQSKEIDLLNDKEKMRVSRILGDTSRKPSYHKGPSITRNITYLRLTTLFKDTGNVLLWYVDSDQEFKVRVNSGKGGTDLYAKNYFYLMNEIFSTTDTCMLTGKVVGDPPVSPSVMAANFLHDVGSFLLSLADTAPETACQFHASNLQETDDASYHDMANLFGFERSDNPFYYQCEIHGSHTNADCFIHFCSLVNRFFYGEHPTRKTFYTHEGVSTTLKAARTVYTGNYVFKPEGLKYFIPFATLKLRMAGPVLGRIVKSEIQERFVSANLPMLHNRTVENTGLSEFRPGINQEDTAIDLSGEFERQFFGDVMLFTIEKLTELGFPQSSLPADVISTTLLATEKRMRGEYNSRHTDILSAQKTLSSIIKDKDNWWNKNAELKNAIGNFLIFISNIERNFGANSPCYELINSDDVCRVRRDAIASAVMRYAEDIEAWTDVLSKRAG